MMIDNDRSYGQTRDDAIRSAACRYQHRTMTLDDKFAQAHVDFQKEMRRIAEANGKTVMYVFGLWRDYCDTWADQSKIVSEFERWYATQLKG